MKRTIPVLLAGALLLLSASVYAATTSFSDVSSSDWFQDDVMNMVEWGVIEGYPDGTFGPGNNVNRAELSAMWNRYDQRVLELANTNGSTPTGSTSTTELTEKTDFTLFLLAHQQAKTAYLYGELAGVSSMLYAEIGYPTDLSCYSYNRYYNSAKEQIDGAKLIDDSIELDDFKIDFAGYDSYLGDFRNQYPDCNFS